jgi:hypothetical protein
MTKDERLEKILKAREMAQLGILFAPPSFKNASPERLLKICDGCGSEHAKIDLVPDTIYSLYVGYACFIHDWQYVVGHDILDKEEADRAFLNNLLRLIKLDKRWYTPKNLMRKRARIYYKMVHWFGGPAFWKGKL